MARSEEAAPAASEAAKDDSRGSRRRPAGSGGAIPDRIRASGPFGWLVLGLGAASALLLFVAELATLSYRTIGIGGCDSRVDPGICSTTGGDAHGYALWLIALLVAVFSLGAALGGSRPAALGTIFAGVVVLGIALLADRPDLDSLRDLDARYTQVRAHTGAGFGLELAGGALSVLAGLAGLRRAASEPRGPSAGDGDDRDPDAERQERRRRRATARE